MEGIRAKKVSKKNGKNQWDKEGKIGEVHHQVLRSSLEKKHDCI